MEHVDKFSVGNLTVKLYQDMDAESPRSWDNLGTMVCFHNRYDLGDGHNFASPSDLLEYLESSEVALALPLFLLDHSGITMRCGSDFRDCDPGGWDSGKVGYIFVTKEQLRKEYSVKRITRATLAKAEQVLRGEVSTYDMLLTGDVYGYVVEDEDGNDLDSCWGFFGHVDAKEQAKAAAESCIASAKQVDKMERECFAV